MLDKIINSMALCVSTEKNETRECLQFCKVEIEDETKNLVRLTSLDGYVLLSLVLNWLDLVNYVKENHFQELPEKPTECYLNVSPKNQKKNKKPFFFINDSLKYPTWQNVIPFNFSCSEPLPWFSAELSSKAVKIITQITDEKKVLNFLPDLWNGPLNPALKLIQCNFANKTNFATGFLLVMPIKQEERLTQNENYSFDLKNPLNTINTWKI